MVAGIGNTIETDLVGEHVAIYDRASESEGTRGVFKQYPYAQGRVRAVTATPDDVSVWLEIIDPDGEGISEYWSGGAKIGDIFVVPLKRFGGYALIRLIKEGTKS